MTLHEAMIVVLRRHAGGWMDRNELAEIIAAEGLYFRRNGQQAPSDQLRLRAHRYGHLFECSDVACSRIRIRRASGARAGVGRQGRPGGLAGPSVDAAGARRRRERAARKYRPRSVDLLLVAESPPRALDRYFYFEDVPKPDALFRYVAGTILATEPTRETKPAHLAALRDRGIFLIDLKPEPTSETRLTGEVPGLIRRIRQLKPRSIILIKTTVYDAAFVALRDSGLPVVDERVPFPGSGQQRRFESAFARALKGARQVQS